MGTKLAPNYANAFMGKLEADFLSTQALKPAFYARLLDDIFLIWNYGQDSLVQFIDAFNNYNESVKLTSSISDSDICFLDIRVYFDSDRQIQTTIYRKPTGGSSYFQFNSSHADHTILSLPLSSAIRASRICSTQKDLDENFQHIFSQFVKQKFPVNVIYKALSKVQNSRKNLDNQANYALPSRTRKRLDVGKAPKLITTFATKIPNLGFILRRHFHILQDAKPTVFSDLPIVVFRRSKNTQDILVSSKFSNIPKKPRGLSPCGDIRCTLCPKQIIGNNIANSLGNPTHSIRSRFNCSTKNVVYLLQCGMCNIQYIGQTMHKFRTRY